MIWADAPCMNQVDIKKRNTHVPLMGRVYSLTTNAVIYLGEASYEEANAVKTGLMAILDFIVPSS